MNKLILITVLALAGMNNARSIGVSLSSGTWNELTINGPGFGDAESLDYGFNSAFGLVTSPSSLQYALASGDRQFTNTGNLALWTGWEYLLASQLSTARAWGELWFLLEEPVNYTWQTTLSGTGSTVEYLQHRLIGSDGNWLSYQLSGSGFMEQGLWILGYRDSVTDGAAFGTFALALTPAVPDGGSTLLLMGLALGVIGILRLPKVIA